MKTKTNKLKALSKKEESTEGLLNFLNLTLIEVEEIRRALDGNYSIPKKFIKNYQEIMAEIVKLDDEGIKKLKSRIREANEVYLETKAELQKHLDEDVLTGESKKILEALPNLTDNELEALMDKFNSELYRREYGNLSEV